MKRLIFTVLAIFAISTSAFSAEGLADTWQHEFKKNPMNDVVSCAVTLKKTIIPSPLIIVFEDATAITVVAKLYPGKDIAARVDKNTPKSSPKMITGNDAEAIIEEVRAGGKELLFQIQQWPKGAPEYFTISMEGFIDHYDACQTLVKAQ